MEIDNISHLKVASISILSLCAITLFTEAYLDPYVNHKRHFMVSKRIPQLCIYPLRATSHMSQEP